ncbi:Putative pentatricopeptide repeat-containing protein [Dendrobium catenatum]|uniref:Pentatricopeptide repeat-containing protein n=1 Tax=Dendrobium catenatum TaxID=906689 RepID=A0A2I0V8K9_9ASPA|nr:Putative pentatricopeptide repeat-containing protein [Dendrobium catenatum]
MADMLAKELTPNVVTYGALISGWSDKGMINKAFDCYLQMTRKGLRPNLFICSTLVSCLYRQDKINEANSLLQKLVDFNIPSKYDFFQRSYNLDSNNLSVNKNTDFFHEVSISIEPNHVICNVAIAGICKSDGKKSETNCRNRSMLKVIHRMGTKSLVAHLYDQDKMMEIREKIIDDGGIVDETIICAEVLGETSSYIRGLGYGPKPIKKTKIARSNASSEREIELETSLKVIQEKYEEQSKIIKSQQKTIDWLKMIAEKMGMQPPNDDGKYLKYAH